MFQFFSFTATSPSKVIWSLSVIDVAQRGIWENFKEGTIYKDIDNNQGNQYIPI